MYDSKCNYPKENQFLIPDSSFNKYNAKTCLMITFKPEGLKKLNQKYQSFKGLPGFINNFLRGRYTPDRELILNNETLCFWDSSYRYMIKPGGASNDQQALLLEHRSIKNKPGGFALVGWIIDPRLFAHYNWDPSAETFKNFLSRNDKPEQNSTYNYLKRTNSQEGISSDEQIKVPYLASILNFTPNHIAFLKEIKKTSLQHLEETYDVNPDIDQVELFFHFPYGEDTTTVHWHIRVNQGRHPLEMTRSISLDKLMTLLEKKIKIADFIANNNPYFMENSQVVLNALDEIEGVDIQLIENPLLLKSPFINIARIFKTIESLQNLIPQFYLKIGTVTMKIKFEDFDKKIAKNELTIENIVEKTLALNIALKNYFPDTPIFRNPVIQGHAAWIIMYEYLSQNKTKLSLEIQNFLQGNDQEEVTIFSQLMKTSKALEQDPQAPIRADINKLNEVAIIKRSPNGQVRHYFNETDKNSLLSLMEQKNILHSKNIFNATFYLHYRPRDGRFFCIPDSEIDVSSDLNLSPLKYNELSSTHFNINEGLNCEPVFKKYFEAHATEILPCTVVSKDRLLYCGIAFKNVEIDMNEMYRLEISKNASIREANILCIKGPINDFKKKYNFPELEQPIPLHLNIGVVLREEAKEVMDVEAKTILDLIEGSIFANSLKKALDTVNSQPQIRCFTSRVKLSKQQLDSLTDIIYETRKVIIKFADNYDIFSDSCTGGLPKNSLELIYAVDDKATELFIRQLKSYGIDHKALVETDTYPEIKNIFFIRGPLLDLTQNLHGCSSLLKLHYNSACEVAAKNDKPVSESELFEFKNLAQTTLENLQAHNVRQNSTSQLTC